MLTPPPPPGGQPKVLPPPPPYPSASGRRTNGQFAAGNAGKRKGTRNKTTRLLEALFEGEAEEIGRVAISVAKTGDVAALRLVLERAAPVRKGRPVEIPGFPKITTVKDVPVAMAFLVGAVAEGRLTPDEAAAVSGVLQSYMAAVEAVDHEARLAAIERAIEDARGSN